MKDERAYELLLSQLGFFREENVSLRKQNEELLAQLKSIKDSYERQFSNLNESLKEMSFQVQTMNEKLSYQSGLLSAKDELLDALKEENANLKNQVKNGRKHHFGRSSEQV